MYKVVTEFLGRLFFTFTNLPTIDDHIVVVRAAVDLEGAKGETVEAHVRLPAPKDGGNNSRPRLETVQPRRDSNPGGLRRGFCMGLEGDANWFIGVCEYLAETGRGR